MQGGGAVWAPKLPPWTGLLASWERALAASISSHLGCEWLGGGTLGGGGQVADPEPLVQAGGAGGQLQGGGVNRGGGASAQAPATQNGEIE